MADVLNQSVVGPARESEKSYDFAILVSVGLLAIGSLVVILASAPSDLQESIQSALIW
jgi:hypothetical protein